MALRVAAEAGVDRGRQKAAAAAFDQLNEADQAQAGSVSDQRQAECPGESSGSPRSRCRGSNAPARRASSRAFRATSSAPAPSAGDGRRSERATRAPRARGRPRDARPPPHHRRPSERRTPSRRLVSVSAIEPQLCCAARSTGNTTGEHVLREGGGHADDVQVQVGRRIEENVILAGRPPEKVARRDRDGRFAVTERRVAGRDQVQLGLGVKMARSPRRRDVMPDVAPCGARDRKRLVQRLRHRSRLPELRARPARRVARPRRFPTKCEVAAGRAHDAGPRRRRLATGPRGDHCVGQFLRCGFVHGAVHITQSLP